MGADYYECVCLDFEYMFKDKIISDTFHLEQKSGYYYNVESYPGNTYDEKIQAILNIQTTKEININSCNPSYFDFILNKIKNKHDFKYPNPNHIPIEFDIQDNEIRSFNKISKLFNKSDPFTNFDTTKEAIKYKINVTNDKNLIELNFNTDIKIQKITQRTYRFERS